MYIAVIFIHRQKDYHPRAAGATDLVVFTEVGYISLQRHVSRDTWDIMFVSPSFETETRVRQGSTCRSRGRCYLRGILVGEIEEGLAEGLADLLVVLRGEVSPAPRAHLGAAHRCLHGVTVLYAHRPHDYPAGTFLALLNVKLAVLEGELRTDTGQLLA